MIASSAMSVDVLPCVAPSRQGTSGTLSDRVNNPHDMSRSPTVPAFDPHVDPVYFASADELHTWFEQHAETAEQLWVGFFRASTGKRTLTWPDAVDEALCVGWIDSVRMGVDEERFANRFTPRRAGSTWSAVNVAKVERLRAQGRMRPAGERAYAGRLEHRTAIYSYEQPGVDWRLSEDDLHRLRANASAWAWWSARPPGYRRLAIRWVVSAKQPQTRERRLAALIEDCAAGRPIKPLSYGRGGTS
jgi:uncharacterized protein YdeI (YjbR/CyaY-like superfamily)